MELAHLRLGELPRVRVELAGPQDAFVARVLEVRPIAIAERVKVRLPVEVDAAQ